MIPQLDLITPTAALGHQLRMGRPVVAQFDEKVSPRGITRAPLPPLCRSSAISRAHSAVCARMATAKYTQPSA